MKLLHNTAAALCCSLILAAMPALAIRYACPQPTAAWWGEPGLRGSPEERASPEAAAADSSSA